MSWANIYYFDLMYGISSVLVGVVGGGGEMIIYISNVITLITCCICPHLQLIF